MYYDWVEARLQSRLLETSRAELRLKVVKESQLDLLLQGLFLW